MGTCPQPPRRVDRGSSAGRDRQKDLAAKVAALRKVVRAADDNHSGDSAHHGDRGRNGGFLSGKFRGLSARLSEIDFPSRQNAEAGASAKP